MKNLTKSIPFILVAFLLIFSFSKSKRVVVIDAGHGGKDNGASYEEYLEKNIVLSIASKIKQLNKDSDTEIILTRDSDNYPSLSERTEFANKINPEMFISLHVNMKMGKNSIKSGPEIYYSEKNKNAEQSKILAEKLAQKIGTSIVKNHDLHVLRNANSPAVMLEVGFIDESKDREYMTSEKGQNEIAKQILNFINEN